MKTQALAREFRYNGAKLTDPSPTFTLQQVRDFYANTYPEIVNAEIEGPDVVGNRNVFTFRRAVGTKGSGTAEPDVRLQIDEILRSDRVSHSVRAYLNETDRFATAHACPLLDEEVVFIGALFNRYAA
ncbi:UNVERIFIED_ORG: PRTRC genetic system protein C [Burkholderia sp. 1263]|uniref:PRTRC system protein C n=1 Tax=Paraburkholderia terricola TaxID=169427 RepID=UPI0009F51F9D|nr:PRTRC system protein C [Paraburkholderia terricola]MDR6445569.1 PRTRC genetic system protein C [Paraburkholderia terricola]